MFLSLNRKYFIFYILSIQIEGIKKLFYLIRLSFILDIWIKIVT